MNVHSYPQFIHTINDQRALKLIESLKTNSLPPRINLDGRGLMIDTDDITLIEGNGTEYRPAKINQHFNPRDAWPMAISRNIRELKENGIYGSWTKQNILDEHKHEPQLDVDQEIQGSQREMRQTLFGDHTGQGAL